MKLRPAHALVLALASLTLFGCSKDTRASIKTDLKAGVSDISAAIDEATNNASEVLARNIATQQGEEQFKNAGQTLAGALTCDAKIQSGVAKIAISCTGTTQGGGAAALTGVTSEIPGASVVALSGEFTGTVDGKPVFTTQRLGG
jgi:hypothetical protein